MNFYDVLFAEKLGGGIPTTNFFDLLFAQFIGGEAWQTYEGTLPATIIANGDDMRQYQVWGNVNGVGDKTENLYNKNNASMNFEGYINTTTYAVVASTVGSFSIIVPVEPNTTYTVVKPATTRFRVGLFTSYPNAGDVAAAIYGDRNGNGMDYGTSLTFTTSNNTSYILAFIRNYNDTQTNEQMKNLTMVLKGSTIPEIYIPYGYKLDISTSDGTDTTTTPIYIGDDPLEKVGNYSDYVDYELQKVVRVIKKYVLTGKEDWEEITGAYDSRKYFRWVFAPINYCIRHACVSSHFTQATITTSTTTVGFDVFDSSTAGGEVLAIRPTNVQSTTFADFKAWLVEQYSAGTPVTIWCALTTAEETDPPVALPALPTCDGTTIVDYEGQSVAPEKVLLEYKKGGN